MILSEAPRLNQRDAASTENLQPEHQDAQAACWGAKTKKCRKSERRETSVQQK